MNQYEYQGNFFETDAPIRGRSPSNVWENCVLHRQRITNTLQSAASRIDGARLCIWGAGACSDVDLNRLAESLAELHLVDIDGQLLQQGVEQQKCLGHHKIHLHGNVDLSGVHDQLLQYRRDPSPHRLDEIIDQAIHFELPELGQFDIVASTCVISQIIQSVVLALGEAHSKFPEAMLALRDRHIELLLDKLSGPGPAFLFTDVVSSDTLPQLGQSVQDLTELLKKAIAERNHFHGVNPFALRHLLTEDPRFKQRLTSVDFSQPWIWDATTRFYCCVAVRLVPAN